MNTGPDLDIKGLELLHQGRGAPDRTCRPIESSKESIACGVNFSTAESI
jgi:hypothetical protein